MDNNNIIKDKKLVKKCSFLLIDDHIKELQKEAFEFNLTNLIIKKPTFLFLFLASAKTK